MQAPYQNRNREGSLLNEADVEAESSLLQERTPDASDYMQGSGNNEEISVVAINELDEDGCAYECNGSLRIWSPLTLSSTVGVSPLSLQPKPNMITDGSISGAHSTVVRSKLSYVGYIYIYIYMYVCMYVIGNADVWIFEFRFLKVVFRALVRVIFFSS